jgi:proline dehydrogenase
LASLTQTDAVRSIVTRLPGAKAVVARFVAGETIDDALRAGAELAANGLKISADHLGENVATESQATDAADVYLRFFDAAMSARLAVHASVKLTQLGLDVSEAVCLANLRRVVHRAHSMGIFVRVDMEGTAYTDRTLRSVREMRRSGYENVGAVIQAYLYRSAEDVAALCADGIRVRLCKGAYKEPPDKAFPKKTDVDVNYVRLAQLLLDAAKERSGLYPALATHDEKMIEAAKTYAKVHVVPSASFELQMLYGIRRDLQVALVKEGFNVRIYVPYGAEWYPYFMRRLAERPANLWFLVSNMFKG